MMETLELQKIVLSDSQSPRLTTPASEALLPAAGAAAAAGRRPGGVLGGNTEKQNVA